MAEGMETLVDGFEKHLESPMGLTMEQFSALDGFDKSALIQSYLSELSYSPHFDEHSLNGIHLRLALYEEHGLLEPTELATMRLLESQLTQEVEAFREREALAEDVAWVPLGQFEPYISMSRGFQEFVYTPEAEYAATTAEQLATDLGSFADLQVGSAEPVEAGADPQDISPKPEATGRAIEN